MIDPIARVDARARTARNIAALAILPPLACHLAAPLVGFDAAPAAAVAEVVAALALRLAGVPLRPIRLPRLRPAPRDRAAAAPLAAIVA